MDVMAELRPIGARYSAGDFRTGLVELTAVWSRIPDPKPDTLNAYLIVEYGVALALSAGDLEAAQEWADRAPIFAAKRHDMGEVEFLLGKVAFARGEMQEAKQHFLIANAKSEGRAFVGKDERYKLLIDKGS